ADLLGYRFWAEDDRGNPLTFAVDDEEFTAPFNRLVADLTRQLKTMSAAPAAGGAPAAPAPRGPKPAAPPRPGAGGPPLHEGLRRPGSSVGLFVGVGHFDPRAHLPGLRYTTDDALALAHLFVRELELIAPQRARVALGGEPTSARAREWRDGLREAGVPRRPRHARRAPVRPRRPGRARPRPGRPGAPGLLQPRLRGGRPGLPDARRRQPPPPRPDWPAPRRGPRDARRPWRLREGAD